MIILIRGQKFHLFTRKAKTKKLCGSGNRTLPTILVPTLIFFFRPVKKILKNRRKSRYCSVQLAIRFDSTGIVASVISGRSYNRAFATYGFAFNHQIFRVYFFPLLP